MYVTWPAWDLMGSHHRVKGLDVHKFREIWTEESVTQLDFYELQMSGRPEARAYSTYSERQAFESVVSHFYISKFTESTVSPKSE